MHYGNKSKDTNKMTDERLRELERLWKESGDLDTGLQYVLERERVGELARGKPANLIPLLHHKPALEEYLQRGGFWIEETENDYRLLNVKHYFQGGLGQVLQRVTFEWGKEILSGEEAQKTKATMPMYHSSLVALRKNEEGVQSELAKKIIKHLFGRIGWVATATRYWIPENSFYHHSEKGVEMMPSRVIELISMVDNTDLQLAGYDKQFQAALGGPWPFEKRGPLYSGIDGTEMLHLNLRPVQIMSSPFGRLHFFHRDDIFEMILYPLNLVYQQNPSAHTVRMIK